MERAKGSVTGNVVLECRNVGRTFKGYNGGPDNEVLRGVDPRLDTEAVRVIESMPTWTPGRNGDQAVPTLYTLPIRFGV